MSDSCDPIGLQHTRLSSPSLSPGVFSNICIKLLMASNLLILCHPLLLLPSSFPASGSFPVSQLFASGGPKYWSFSISPSNVYSELISLRIYWFDILAVQGTLKSLQSSPAPQFKSINSSVLSLLYGPTLTSVHDCWKNHSLDYIDWQSDVSAF